MATHRQRAIGFFRHIFLCIAWAVCESAEHWKAFVATVIGGGFLVGIGCAAHKYALGRWPVLQASTGVPMGEILLFLFYVVVPATAFAIGIFVFLCAVAPSQIHLEQEDEIAGLKRSISKMSTESPRGCIRGDGPMFNFVEFDDAIEVSIQLFNVSEQLLSVSPLRVDVWLDDQPLRNCIEQGTPFLIARQSQARYIGAVVKNVGWQSIAALELKVTYEISYDSVPPISQRISKKTYLVTAPIPPVARRTGKIELQSILLEEFES